MKPGLTVLELMEQQDASQTAIMKAIKAELDRFQKATGLVPCGLELETRVMFGVSGAEAIQVSDCKVLLNVV